MSTLLYLREFLGDRQVASVAATGRGTVRRVLDRVDWPSVAVVVEYGPALGVFSSAVLERLRPDGVLLLIERNARFAATLRGRIADPRVRLHHGSAEQVLDLLGTGGPGTADVVLSGIPFSLMDPELRATVLARTHEALRPGGKLIVYQSLVQLLMPGGGVVAALRQRFDGLRVYREPLNVPPLMVCEAFKS